MALSWGELKHSGKRIPGGNRAGNITGAIGAHSVQMVYDPNEKAFAISADVRSLKGRYYPYGNYSAIRSRGYQVLIRFGPVELSDGYKDLLNNITALKLRAQYIGTEVEYLLKVITDASNHQLSEEDEKFINEQYIPFPSISKVANVQVKCDCPDFTYTAAPALNKVRSLAAKPAYYHHQYPVHKYPLGLRNYPKHRDSRNPNGEVMLCKHIYAVVDYLIANGYIRK